MKVIRTLAQAAVLATCAVLAACGPANGSSGGVAAAAERPPATASAAAPTTGAAAIAEVPEGGCDASPRQTEGPFYFDIGQVRREITEGKPGTPLLVALRIVAAGSCEPVRDVFVDIWHTDAAGQYSGYPGQGDDRADTSGETFLRGRQVTDAEGRVEFETIYPGWYPGRTVHIHFKAFTSEGRLIASQLYFPDEVSDAVFESEPYSARGPRGTRNTNDSVGRDEVALQALMGQLMSNGDGYVVSLTVGVVR